MPFDFKKEYKEFYLPPAKPVIVIVPKANYIAVRGKGEPLILLHGNGENCDDFTGQVDAFAKYYHVYALDTRGHGKTP